MKTKLTILFSLLVVGSMIITACGSGAAPTEAPAETQAPAATDAPAATAAPAARSIWRAICFQGQHFARRRNAGCRPASTQPI